MNKNDHIDIVGWVLLICLFSLLTYAGYLSYKSIDWTVLKRLEATKLILPSPLLASPSATLSSPSARPIQL
jgi:hypothetical protein